MLNRTINYCYLCLLFVCCIQFTNAQSTIQKQQIEALNNYVHFSNESIHGMLIIHRMFENFNQEVNKYVDLQSNQLNFYGNSDLPRNIFEDPENWFYDTSPYEWYIIAKKGSKNLETSSANRLNASLDLLKQTVDRVNEVRFELENFIKNNDLTKSENQTEMYAKLENCVALYDDFYENKEALYRDLVVVHEQNIKPVSNSYNTPITALQSVQQLSKDLLEALHFSLSGKVADLSGALDNSVQKAKQYSTNNKAYKASIKAAMELLDFSKKYNAQSEFSDKYALYGKNYYYHNVQFASAFNRYGSGFVKHTNEFITQSNSTYLLLVEEPHYLKIVYPKKKIETPKAKITIDKLPAKVENRTVVVRQQKIQVDEKKVLLEIFDHKQEDGDVVSLNFNGNWILKSKKLEKRPIKLLVDLNADGNNYIILHAENLGDVPPNTIAIRYHFEGRRKLVVLNSDLDESEMILLNYVE